MAIIGIIAEFNPLHNGHRYLIEQAKKQGHTVCCAMSGNFVQRGDTAIFPKAVRARAALRCGVDWVAELPVLWSMSTAQNFAVGGVSQLMALGCDEIWFGSESGDLDRLTQTARILSAPDFETALDECLKNGTPFAAARIRALEKIGFSDPPLSEPNDTLGVEYIAAANRLGFLGTFHAVKRVGAGHDVTAPDGDYASASMIREQIRSKNAETVSRFLPDRLQGYYDFGDFSLLSRIDRAILAAIRTKTAAQLARLPDIGEGLENRIVRAAEDAPDFLSLCDAVKCKRYSHARIRRLILSAFLDFDREFFLKRPPYVRLLGMREDCPMPKVNPADGIPIITKISQLPQNDPGIRKVFETECRAADLYGLTFSSPLPCGSEYKTKFIKESSL